MKIGIDASRAFLKDRTGIEEYSYQVIKNLVNDLKGHEVVLYVRKNQKVDFELPSNWQIKTINFYYFWTQLGLSLEMLFHPVDALFIPAHTVPLIHPARNVSLFSLALIIQKLLKSFGIGTNYNQHSDAGGPKNTIVTIHGLEYEFCPKAYSFWEKLYMRSSIKKSCQWARTIIAVSQNTKNDLINLYKVPAEKIKVIYEGYENNDKFPISNFQSISNNKNPNVYTKYNILNTKYLLFIGRLEERKNVVGIIKSFEILKEQYKISHKLVLAGSPGFGYEKIKNEIANVNCVKDIIETGFVSVEEKNELLKNADVFLFPSFYEGFGLPILEAQNAGVPVVASIEASIPEVTGDSALLVDPKNAEEIADAVYKIISEESIKKDLVQKGLENIKRFSWEKCATEIAKIILN
ncbi:MAG TPA: glycosyltransferase family 1 protein [Candidatus Moranbacteria bacterium]|nr:glycosyltransferase family 1 protein [Candidatus Moranbacteria bacterium]